MSLAIATKPHTPLDDHDLVRLETERPGDGACAEALADLAFGPGRFAKTAERLREGARLRPDLSQCAWAAAELVGTVRLWSIRIGESDAIFLGPIAVRPDRRGLRLGSAMVVRACDAATAAGETLILLVGAASFFEPLGFQLVEPGRVLLPGSVDPARLLWRPLRSGGTDGVAGRARG